MKKLQILTLLFFFTALLSMDMNAQDQKKEPVKEKQMKSEKMEEGCGTEMSCCSTKEKSASTVKPWNEVCPVLGNKINTSVKTVEYQGKVYGFCCAGCDSKFAKDPEKYSKNLSSDGKSFTKSKG
jgi:YHS domain-containing protein